MPTRYSKRIIQVLYGTSCALFAFWFLMGFIAVGFNHPTRFNHWEDFLFLLLAALVLYLRSVLKVGWIITTKVFLIIVLLSGLVEAVGVLTGFPFGSYEYTGTFGPRLLGILPAAIPLAWWVVVYPLFTLIARLRLGWLFTGMLTALLATLFDVGLEPVATILREYWLWEDGLSFYYGVPISNFFGWFLTTFIISLTIFTTLTRRQRKMLEESTAITRTGLILQACIIATFCFSAWMGGLYAGGVILTLLFVAVLYLLKKSSSAHT